jgi:cytochrome c oxidase subunit 2
VLKRIVVVAEVVALLAAGITLVMLFAMPADEPSSGGDETAGLDAPADGAAGYQSSCSSCHGPDGDGGIGPRLGGGAVVEAFPDEADQIAIVTQGRGGMPGFGGALSAAEIEAIVTYTRDELGR